MTLDEIMVALGLNQGAGTRIAELRRAGYVEDSGKTRLTRSGSQAIVWRVPAAVVSKCVPVIAAVAGKSL